MRQQEFPLRDLLSVAIGVPLPPDDWQALAPLMCVLFERDAITSSEVSQLIPVAQKALLQQHKWLADVGRPDLSRARGPEVQNVCDDFVRSVAQDHDAAYLVRSAPIALRPKAGPRSTALARPTTLPGTAGARDFGERNEDLLREDGKPTGGPIGRQ